MHIVLNMKCTDKLIFAIYFSAYITVQICLAQNTEVKHSDACHGPKHVEQTYNKLDCEEGYRICITDVRYYQYHEDGCVHLLSHNLSESMSEKCCRRNTTRCNWNNPNQTEMFQKNCSNSSHCRLHSPTVYVIAKDCTVSISSISSVRSITYICASATEPCHPTPTSESSSASTPQPQASTAFREVKPEKSSTFNIHPNTTSVDSTMISTEDRMQQFSGHENNVARIAGGVIGSLVFVAVAVFLFIVIKRRSGKAAPPPADYPLNNYSTPPTPRPTPGYDEVYIGTRQYSLCRPERAGDGESVDRNGEAAAPLDRYDAVRLSGLYTKVNKNQKEGENARTPAFSVQPSPATTDHSDYDRVQGEAAHFRDDGHYDHVAEFADVSGASDVMTRHGADNPGFDTTYDQLRRGQAVTTASSTTTETNPYDVLKRDTTADV